MDLQLSSDRQAANVARATLNHLIQDRPGFSDCERHKLREAQLILRDFVERTRRDVDGTI